MQYSFVRRAQTVKTDSFCRMRKAFPGFRCFLNEISGRKPAVSRFCAKRKSGRLPAFYARKAGWIEMTEKKDCLRESSLLRSPDLFFSFFQSIFLSQKGEGMDDSRNNRSGCLEEIFNLLLTFAFLQFFLNLFYPPPEKYTSEGKPRTSGCMKALGILCCLIILGTILKTCA